MSVIFAITVNPKSCVATYPYIAALGHVTDTLKNMYGWSDQLVDNVKKACKAKNERINDAGLFQLFFDTLGRTLVTRGPAPEDVTDVAMVR